MGLPAAFMGLMNDIGVIQSGLPDPWFSHKAFWRAQDMPVNLAALMNCSRLDFINLDVADWYAI